MDAKTIILEKQMRDDISETLNKYVNEIPAILIASHLNTLATKLMDIADEQYNEAVKVLEESEVKSNV